MDEKPTTQQDQALTKLAADICSGGTASLRSMFESASSQPPLIKWSPDISDLRHPLVVRFAQLCQTLCAADGMILASDFTLDAFSGLKDWMTILDNDGGDLRYSHYGDGISTVRGFSKKDTVAAAHRDLISEFFQGVYRAVQTRKEWLLTVHEPPRKIFARNWESLALPLLDTTGAVSRLINISVPDNELRPGLEIIPDPVLIVDQDQIVRFANRAAREMFDHQIYIGTNMDLFTFSGINFTPPAPPEEMAQSRAVHDVVSIVLRDTMIERFLLTISATEQWGTAYYVLTLRPAVEQKLDPATG